MQLTGNTILINGWRDAYVAYRVVGGVALALGDPVGTADGSQRAIEEFLDLCAARGWTPCFYATTGQALPFATLLPDGRVVGATRFLDLQYWTVGEARAPGVPRRKKRRLMPGSAVSRSAKRRAMAQ